jgi:hypothetical protein
VTALRDMPGLPRDVAAALDELVEIDPDGTKKRFGDCSWGEVAGSYESAQEGVLNHREIAALLQRAMAENVAVGAELLQRLDSAESGPEVIAVRDELRSLVPRSGR